MLNFKALKSQDRMSTILKVKHLGSTLRQGERGYTSGESTGVLALYNDT
jgi:hypothetical protein